MDVKTNKKRNRLFRQERKYIHLENPLEREVLIICAKKVLELFFTFEQKKGLPVSSTNNIRLARQLIVDTPNPQKCSQYLQKHISAGALRVIAIIQSHDFLSLFKLSVDVCVYRESWSFQERSWF